MLSVFIVEQQEIPGLERRVYMETKGLKPLFFKPPAVEIGRGNVRLRQNKNIS